MIRSVYNNESSVEILEPNRDILEKIEENTYKINDSLCLIKFMIEIICLILTYRYLNERATMLVFIMIFVAELINEIYRKLKKEKNNGKF
jgi:hypothetical protein